MQGSCPSSDRLNDILLFFSLGELSSKKKMSFGLTNNSFLVKTNRDEEYVIRLINNFDKSLFENEIAIQRQLSKANLQTSYMLQAEDGRCLYSKNGAYATISKRIKGFHPTNVSVEDCRLIGFTLGLFHCSVHELPHINQKMLIDPKNVARRYGCLESFAYKDKITKLLSSSKRLLNETNLPTGITHGDLHVNNLLLHNGKLAILDMDCAGRACLLLDIARSIADVCSEKGALNLAKADAFLTGYNRRRRLTEKETVYIAEAVIYSSAAVALWFCEYGNYEFANHFIDTGLHTINNSDSYNAHWRTILNMAT